MGGAGLILTEATGVEADGRISPADTGIYTQEQIEAWARIVKFIEQEGSVAGIQLAHAGRKASTREPWHGGSAATAEQGGWPGVWAPSALKFIDSYPQPIELDEAGIQRIIGAFAQAAKNALQAGFKVAEIHAAHGYLIDEFFWHETNVRTDRYGGDISQRTRFGADIVKGIRARTSPTFPIVLRYSQWKLQDFTARPWPTPDDLEKFLRPMVDAGVDVFDCSQRRFWTPEFEGSELNLAGWTQKLSGRPAISVGSVTIGEEFLQTLLEGLPGPIAGIQKLIDRMEKDEFDLIAVGRALIANPDWPQKVRANQIQQLQPFSRAMLADLI